LFGTDGSLLSKRAIIGIKVSMVSLISGRQSLIVLFTYLTEAKCACKLLGCKYIEVSASLNHRVDELLVGIVRQIRLTRTPLRRRRSGKGVRGDRPSVGGCSGSDSSSTISVDVACVKGAKELLKELFTADTCLQASDSDCENLLDL
jgi:hypothetical protein